ncbi:MAG: nuclear transport factor 2 family protein, partial [Fulvivirga sp.]
MNKPIFKIIASTLLLIIGFVAGTFHNPSIDETKNEIVTSGPDFEMIEEVTNEFVTAWIKGDAEGCANTYSENAVFMVPNQPSYHGRAAIKERYEKMFNQRNDSTRIEMTETVKEVIFLDDWAVIRGSGYETRDSERSE